MLESSSNVSLHLMVLTDPQSLEQTGATVASSYGKFLTEGVVFGLQSNHVTLITEFIGKWNSHMQLQHSHRFGQFHCNVGPRYVENYERDFWVRKANLKKTYFFLGNVLEEGGGKSWGRVGVVVN